MISISIRYYDFRNAVRSLNLDYSSDDENIIFEHAMLLFDQNYEDIPIRHLGVGMGSLSSKDSQIEQLTIFTAPKPKMDILEELNKQIIGSKLIYASSLVKEKE